MTCKDCVYEPMCHSVIAYGMDTDDITGKLITDIEKHCQNFKDKSRFIDTPCKVGDTVYAIGNKDGHQIKECRVEDFCFASAEDFQVDVYFECDQDCEGCYFNDWSQSHCGEWSCSGEYGNGLIPVNDFGKNVFLTREEAKQALAERQGD